MKTIYLTTKNLACATHFYQHHLHATLVSQSPSSTVLNIAEQQLLVELSLPAGEISTHYSELRFQLTSTLLNKMTNSPEIFHHQFMSPRPVHKNQLPIELQDYDGYRWQIYSQFNERH